MLKVSPTAERVLANASELFLIYGFQDVSMDRVAEAAGITKVTVYQHFKTKDTLLVECLRWRMVQREAALDALEGETSCSAEMLEGLFEWMSRNALKNGYSGCAFLKAANEVAVKHPAVREVAREAKALMRKRCTRLAARAGCADAEGLGQLWTLLLDGAQLLSMVELSVEPFVGARKQALLALGRECEDA